MTGSSLDRDGARLRARMHGLVRRAGWLAPDRTACGIALPPSHAHALMILAESPSPLLPRDLAATLGLDKSSATRLCQRLAEAGHVTSTRDAADGRSVRIALTQLGRRAATRVADASAKRHAALARAIPRGERAAVVRALEVLDAALAAVEAQEDE